MGQVCRYCQRFSREDVMILTYDDPNRTYYSRGAGESVFDALEAARLSNSPRKLSVDKNLPSSPIRPQPPGKQYRRQSSPVTYSPTFHEDPSTQRSTLRKPVEVVWSPHLYHDRSSKRLSMWQAPQVEEKTTDGLFSRRRLQIIFFSLGFIFPFGS